MFFVFFWSCAQRLVEPCPCLGSPCGELVLWGVGGAVGRDWCCGAWVMLWGVAGAVWRGSPATPGNRKIEVRFCKNGCPGARGLATQTRTRRDGARAKTAASAPMLCSKTLAILNKKHKPVSGATVQTRTRRDGRLARPATNPYQARRSAKKSNAGFSEFSDDF